MNNAVGPDNTVGPDNAGDYNLQLASNDNWGLKKMNNPTMYAISIAILKNGYQIQDLDENLQTESICMLAIARKPLAFKYIKVQTIILCMFAVNLCGDNLQYVKNEFRTPEIIKLAIENNGISIRFLKEEEQTFDLCKLAIDKDRQAINELHGYPACLTSYSFHLLDEKTKNTPKFQKIKRLFDYMRGPDFTAKNTHSVAGGGATA